MDIFAKPLFDRRRVFAILVAVATGTGVATVIARRELTRVLEIYEAMPFREEFARAVAEERVVCTIAIASSTLVAASLCIAMAITRPNVHGPIVGCLAPILGLLAAGPVYWFVYRDAPPGWHFNVAKEYRWAQPAGVVEAVIVYAIVRIIQRWTARDQDEVLTRPT